MRRILKPEIGHLKPKLLAFKCEAIADAMDRLHVHGFLWPGLDLFTHAANVHVYATRSDGAIVAPHAVQQMISRENQTRVRREIVQQSKPQRTQLDMAPRDIYGMRRRIDVNVSVLEAIPLRGGILAS